MSREALVRLAEKGEYCPDCWPRMRFQQHRVVYCADHSAERAAQEQRDQAERAAAELQALTPPPKISRIVPADLTNPARLGALYVDAVLNKRWVPDRFSNTEAAVNEFINCAARAVQKDHLGTPEKLFGHFLSNPKEAHDQIGNVDEDIAKALVPWDMRPDIAEAAAEAMRAAAPAKDRALTTAVEQQMDLLGGEAHIGLLHFIMVHCFLPHHPYPGREYVSKHGKLRLIVTAGNIGDPDGDPDREESLESCEVPWGTRARLILPYMIREALRHKTRLIDLRSSLKGLLTELGLEYGGKMRAPFLRQIHNLATAHFRLIGWNEAGSWTHSGQFVTGMQLWNSATDSQSQWYPCIHLSHDFYEAIQEYIVPVRLDHLRRLSRSSRHMDIYVWLASRVYGMRKPIPPIPLSELQSIFGRDIHNPQDFKRKFRKALVAIQNKDIWPELSATIQGDYLCICKSKTPVRSFTTR